MDVDQTGSVRRLRQMILNFESRQVVIRITDDMKEPEQLIERLNKQGIKFVAPTKNEQPITAFITGAAPDEIDWMQHLLSGLRRNMVSVPELRREGSEEQAKAVMKASPTAKYFRGLAKIGFHYFLKYMPGFHGSEEAFAEIRDFIVDGKATGVDHFVNGRREQLITDIVWGESPTGYRDFYYTSHDTNVVWRAWGYVPSGGNNVTAISGIGPVLFGPHQLGGITNILAAKIFADTVDW